MFQCHDELRELISFGVTPEELAQCGFDPKAPDSFSVTALNPVCAAGDLPLVAWLLEIGADPGAHSADGFTPLLAAIDTCRRRPAESLAIVALPSAPCRRRPAAAVEGRGDRDKTPFLKACTRGEPAMLRLLTAHGADVHATAQEIGGPMGALDVADVVNASPEFRALIRALQDV